MLVSQQQKLQDEIRVLVARHGCTRAALVPILQALQERYASVSDFAMQVVADELGIHPAEVYGVVSFYAFLHHQPRGRFQVRLCQTISGRVGRHGQESMIAMIAIQDALDHYFMRHPEAFFEKSHEAAVIGP